jgi:hypothetical protein
MSIPAPGTGSGDLRTPILQEAGTKSRFARYALGAERMTLTYEKFVEDVFRQWFA